MPVVTVNTEISFDIADIDNDVIEHELKRRPDLMRNVEDDLRDKLKTDIADFDTADLLAELESREVDIDRPWIEKLYRLVAEGRNDEALDLIYSESGEGLAPPSTEKRTANLLAGKRVPTNVQN